MLLGSVADDFTGATDLCSMLVRGGMRTVQLIGTPAPDDPVPDADAVVVAIKSRTAPVEWAVGQSLAALAWLRKAGARQYFFKYCSTFDSTDQGNIGPIADAMIRALDCGFSLHCPAFPTNGRTVYLGHLFAGGVLLNESGMEHHPLTPMTDANLVRVLSRQTDGTVGLVAFPVVEAGGSAIRDAMTRLKEEGRSHAIVDAVTDAHLIAIGEAAAHHALVCGGSGVAMGLPGNFRRAGLLPAAGDAGTLPDIAGAAAVLSGSCSRATLNQLGYARAQAPVHELNPLATPNATGLAEIALNWTDGKIGAKPVIIAASAPPDKVAAIQAALGGPEKAGALLEDAMARIAEGLIARGVRRMVVAGGETSGAVVTKLGVRQLRIGVEIDPGVPWTLASGNGADLLLALKSGNFGAPDFFPKAFQMLKD
ncbi:MAG: four-carbon acid sugar kinase family protein [Acetobacteraceae bacterium]|nr:four-carbon acid sugar kinase family protein [Acetobacteraceae bacterium]